MFLEKRQGARRFPADFAGQTRQTLANTLAVLGLAGAGPEHIVRMTWYVCDIDEYRTAVADNLRHPVIRALRQRGASLELPWRHWLCGTPHSRFLCSFPSCPDLS